MNAEVPMTEFRSLCDKITRDCESIRRAFIVIYVELAVFVLAGTFGLGVTIGKTLCR